MPLILILAECGIELIPNEIKKHSSVQRNIKKDNYAAKLLDNALHHSAMVKLKNADKRGRPDITHSCLLNALGSSLNKEGKLKIYMHTYHNEIYEFNPGIKLTRNYNRFKGLIAKLISHEEIVFEDLKLISKTDYDINSLIKTFKNREVILFSSKGKLIENHLSLFKKDIDKNYIAIVGGFQKGDIATDIKSITESVVSISKYSLDAWIVVSKILTLYEITNDIF